jgi:hypothetical protein
MPGHPAPPAASSKAAVRLSKSRIAAFEHCRRRLWLQIHRPGEADHDCATLKLFAAGHLVGELARVKYADGILVAEGPREIDAALARTKELVRASGQRPIFEAAFIRDNVVIRADILEPDGWGGWKLIEVKNSRSVKDAQLRDVATQSWVIGGNRLCLSSVVIRHVERPLRNEQFLLQTRFVDADVSGAIRPLVKWRQAVVDEAKATASGNEPAIKPGVHCVRPFRCEFRNHCNRGL